MTNDQYRAALDLVAALDDNEMEQFLTESRKPSQLTRDDEQALARARRHADIEAAREAGRLDALLGVPADQIELVARARNLEPVTRAELAELNRLGRHDLVAAYSRSTDRIITD